MPLPVGAALLASADGYTPRANAALDKAREELGTIEEIANALADNLPAPKLTARKSRRRRRKRKRPAQAEPDADGNVADRRARPEPTVDSLGRRAPEPVAEPAEDAGLAAAAAVLVPLAQEAGDLGGQRLAGGEQPDSSSQSSESARCSSSST